MKKRWRFAVPIIAVVLLIGLLAIGLTLDPRKVPSPLIGKPMPAFYLTSVKDPAQTLSDAQIRGQVALLNVWASWCEACREEHPLIRELAAQDVVPIYGLNYKDTRDDALTWLTRFGDPYRTSGFDESGDVGIDWGVYGVPETFLIDRQGRVRYKHVGPITRAVLKDELLPLIAQLKAEP